MGLVFLVVYKTSDIIAALQHLNPKKHIGG